MAFESNLPTGSVPFTNLMYKDTNDRIWAGSERNSEFYRFLDPADMPYINIKDFGAVGDGVTDDTSAFDEAVSMAKVMKMYLYIPSGKFSIDVSQNTINMNGCAGIMGEGELVFEWSGDRPDLPILQWVGTRQQVASGVSVSKYQNEFVIPTGLALNQGDTLFFVTNELIVSDMTVNYCRGMRFTVDSYNADTGALTTFEYSYYEMTSATVWHNDQRPRVKLQGVKMTLVGDLQKKGIEIVIGEAYIDFIKMTGFGICGFNCSSSFGRVTNSEIFSPSDDDNTNTGYAIQSSGLTDLYVGDSNLFGARHGFAAGDHGYWRNSDVGATPSDTVIQMPSINKISGTRLEGNLYALDSHGGTTLLDVYMCDVYGGCQFGGVETYITNSRIYSTKFAKPYLRAGVRLGRDRPEGEGGFHGKYAIRNCEIHASGYAFILYTNIESLELTNVRVYPTSDAIGEFFDYRTNSRINTININGFYHIGEGSPVIYTLNPVEPLHVKNMNLKRAQLYVYGRNLGIDIKITDSSFENPGNNGIYVRSVNGANRSFSVMVANTIMIGCATGIKVADARTLLMSSVQLKNNTTSVVLENRVSGAVKFISQGCEYDQAAGNVIDLSLGQVTETVLIGNVFTQSAVIAIPTAQIVGKYGNIGLDDKLKTALTSASTSKYGAASGSGDLTLS